MGPAVAAGAWPHDENARSGHHLSPPRPEVVVVVVVVVDDLNGVPLEERPHV
ncbi:hypothetical protein [Streptomyces sp. NPDC014995]|uniref:hypothetical protein n=1 Tax=Streptomyces sp. NPDC014995 TaxID=3364936 RepID=UPI003702FD1F